VGGGGGEVEGAEENECAPSPRGGRGGGGGGGSGGGVIDHPLASTSTSPPSSPLGRAVQVDPMKPTLKVPGSKRLKLEAEKMLSNFAFKFNLRGYSPGAGSGCASTCASCPGW